MGAMCGQSSEPRSCLTGAKDSPKIAVYGPPKTGKSTLLSYLFNKQNSKSEKILLTGAKKQEYLSNFFCPSNYNGTKFQELSQRSKLLVQSKKDNGLPYHLWHIYGKSNANKSPIYHICFAQIKNSEGNIFPILQGLFLCQAFIMVVDAETIDELYKFQRLSIHAYSNYRIILLNKIDQLTQQSSVKLYQLLENSYKNRCIIIPISSKDGDNIFHRSQRTSWYSGPTLIDVLQGQTPYISYKQKDFYQSISSYSGSDVLVIKVTHKSKKTTTIFGVYTGGGFYGIHIEYVLQVLPLGIAATVVEIDFQVGIYVSFTLDQYLAIDEEKGLYLKSHMRQIPQAPTSLNNLQTIQGTISYFDIDSIKQPGFKCLIQYHNKVVKGQLLSYSDSYKDNELKRHAKIHLSQVLCHQSYRGRFYLLDYDHNPFAVGVQEAAPEKYRPVVYDVQPIKREPLKVEEEVQYKITLEMKSKKILK